jgi:hypothetical protein
VSAHLDPSAEVGADVPGRAAGALHLAPRDLVVGAVDLETGRTPEMPDTFVLPPEPPAEDLDPTRRVALERLSARITDRARRPDEPSALGPDARLAARLDAAELASWLADGRLLERSSAEADVERGLSAARAAARPGVPQRMPSDRQHAALVALAREAPSRVDLTWNPLRGSPRIVEGVLDARRSAEPARQAQSWIDTHRALLSDLLVSDDRDELVLVDTVDVVRRSEAQVFFVRRRDGLDFVDDGVIVTVTTAEHPLGPGLLVRLWITWDRDAAQMPTAPLLDDDALRRLAVRHLPARRTRGGEALTLRRYILCDGEDEGRACEPYAELTGTAGAVVGDDTTEPDTVVLHAVTGELRAQWSSRHAFTGSIDIVSNFPHDAVDQARDYRLARMLSDPAFHPHQADDFGEYDWTPPGGASAAWVGLDLTSASGTGRWHLASYDCAAPVDPVWSWITLGGTALVTSPPNSTTMRRHDLLAWGWLFWVDDVQYRLNNLTEVPQGLGYDVQFPAAGLDPTLLYAQFGPCNGAAGVERGMIGVSIPNDGATVTKWARNAFFQEYFHGLQWCTQTWGPGCGNKPNLLRGPLPAAWAEGTANAFGDWANLYETNGTGYAALRDVPFLGIDQPGDIVVYDEEIDGTPTTGPGCTSSTVCNFATEACWVDAHSHHRNRCMRRATTPCATLFPDQPQIATINGGHAPGGVTGIPICAHDNYKNGLLWGHYLTQYALTNGWYDALATMGGGNRYLTVNTELTQTAENFHTLFAQLDKPYDVSRVMHAISRETFPWLDDASDNLLGVEVLRPARVWTVGFANGGGSAAPLRFDSLVDVDAFMIPVVPGKAYTVQATSGGTSVDVCIVLRTVGGALVQSSPGCTDGASTPATRNATLSFSGLTEGRYVLRFGNALPATGTYSFTVTQTNDDYPDALTDAAFAEPMWRDGSTRAGRLNSTTDRDLWRYDLPPTAAGGTLGFAVSGVSPAPTLEVWRRDGTALPGGSPGWTGTGSVSIPAALAGRYYVRVNSTGATGTYTLSRSSSCTNCNESGTYAAPLKLPTASGGYVFERLDAGYRAPSRTSVDCTAGATCDWYEIALTAGEWLAATTYDVFDAACKLELAVYGPPEMVYFQGATPEERFPAVLDEGGSLESNAASLLFVAPKDGLYRIAVRAGGVLNCPYYTLGVTRGPVESSSFVLRPEVR